MKRLMTHVVVGYPDLSTTKRLVQAMINLEVAAIELQIPFSDPIADGPVLVHANDVAAGQGFSVEQTLELLKSVDTKKTKLFIMSYLQPILHYGPKAFFQKALAAGCKGFIIPDLPFDAPEIKQFLTDQPELRQTLVPVLSSGMSGDRLSALFKVLQPSLIYLTARHGITGDQTDFTSSMEEVVEKVRGYSQAELAIGFGIQTPADIRYVLQIADLAVVGSVLTTTLDRSEDDAKILLDALCRAAG